MNKTPPYADAATSCVLSAVCPRKPAIKSRAAEASTNLFSGRTPFSYNACPTRRANSVLPTPGGPEKTMFRVIVEPSDKPRATRILSISD